jgi:hypothetical protein
MADADPGDGRTETGSTLRIAVPAQALEPADIHLAVICPHDFILPSHPWCRPAASRRIRSSHFCAKRTADRGPSRRGRQNDYGHTNRWKLDPRTSDAEHQEEGLRYVVDITAHDAPRQSKVGQARHRSQFVLPLDRQHRSARGRWRRRSPRSRGRPRRLHRRSEDVPRLEPVICR